MTIGPDFPAVLAAARRADPDALTVIYRDLAPLVLGYARGLGVPDPDDVTSETFVSVVRGIQRFDGGESQFRSWVLRITHRRAMDELRRRGRRREDTALTDEAGDAVLDLTSGEAQALTRLHAQRVLDAIDTLTEDQRAVLLLRTLADLPVREVARILDMKETAVKALQRRAVAAVRRRVWEMEG